MTKNTDTESNAISWRYGAIAEDDIRKIKKWLNSQRNKNEAITHVILHFIQRYGNNDVLNYETQRKMFSDSNKKGDGLEKAIAQALKKLGAEGLNFTSPSSNSQLSVKPATEHVGVANPTPAPKPAESATGDAPVGKDGSIEKPSSKPVEAPTEQPPTSADTSTPVAEQTPAEADLQNKPAVEDAHMVDTAYSLPNADVTDMLNGISSVKLNLSRNDS